jgi:glucose uptake protein
MILPQTYAAVLLLMILSPLCLGSWPSLYKSAGRWRFELFYFDFAFGLAVTAAIAAFTLGNLGYDGFSVMDDLIHAGKRQWMFAFLAGVAFNLGNMLLTGAISVAGMAVAFPIGMGLSVVAAMLYGRMQGARLNGTMLAAGSALMALAILFAAMAYANAMRARREALLAQDKKRAARTTGAAKGLILAIFGGLLIAGMYPLLAKATPPEIGLGAYSLMGLFAAGVLGSTLLFNIFFMNLPVQGDPLEIADFLKQKPKLHLLGLLAGMMWCAGTLANWVSGGAPPEARLSRTAGVGLSGAGILLATLWGLAVWKDLREARTAGRVMAAVMVLLLAGGLALLSMAIAPPANG